jgi:hypothetical protein
MNDSVSAEIVTVYRALDGGLHHARCGQRMRLQGKRTDELDFYCLTCAESVPLPLCVLARIPVADDGPACVP